MIKGTLVGLRAVEREDLPNLRDWRNIDSFRRNFREVRELSMAHQEGWYDRQCVGNPNDFMFVIERLSDGKAIGACGLLYINWVIRSGDFSFYIGEGEAYIDDEGYAEDAARLLIQYGFDRLGLNKIWMELYEFDVRKLTFFEGKFGFSRDGTLRQNCYADGRFWDSHLISLLKEEFNG
jgi:hypothetical protein